MNEITRIARMVQKTGFQCTRCGLCCSAVEKDSDLVMVSPPEIHAIIDGFGLCWDEVAEPYPEIIEDEKGCRFTIGWCLKRTKNHCRFLVHDSCGIYKKRPWICRTYPFSLSEENLQISPCPGIGRKISWEDAVTIAQDLLGRMAEESSDEAKIQTVLQKEKIPASTFVVIDSEGMKTPSGKFPDPV